MPARGAARWPQTLFECLLCAGVTQVAYVPDAGHAWLIERCHAEPRMRPVVLTSEQEGVALLCGAWLGGERGVLLMQSSGVGNCVNLLGMARECRFPLLAVVAMRGEWGEFNPWQVPMGRSTPAHLEHAGVLVERVERADELGERVSGAARLAFASERRVAVLLSQRMIGAKSWR